jgi:hypothetical protein
MNLEARVAELERMLAAAPVARSAPDPIARPALDPVELTKALHPRGLRVPKRAGRRSGDLSLRLFFFVPPGR